MAGLFVVTRSRGAAWSASQPLEAQKDWAAHAAFMDALHEEGFVVLAGPLEQANAALLVVRAGSSEEIVKRLAADPWTTNGLLYVTRIDAWTLRLGSLP
jgi:uncharacterized protein YciI